MRGRGPEWKVRRIIGRSASQPPGFVSTERPGGAGAVGAGVGALNGRQRARRNEDIKGFFIEALVMGKQSHCTLNKEIGLQLHSKKHIECDSGDFVQTAHPWIKAWAMHINR